jgi:predicted amidohydrolase YtcJ
MINLPTGGSLGTGIGIPYLLQGQMDRKKLDGLAPATPILVQAGAGAWLMNTAARNNLLEYYEVPPTDENENLAITIGSVFDRALITDRYFDNHQEELIEVLDRQMKYQAAGGFTTYASHIVGIRFMPAFRQMVERKQMSLRLAFSHRYCQQIEPDNAGCFLRLGDWQNLGDPYYWNVGITLGGIDAGPPTICTTIEVDPKYKSQELCILKPGSPYAKAVYVAFRSRYRYTVNHAYGDQGLDHVMDIMEQVMKDNPDITLNFMKSMRISSDHCGLYPRPSQIPRMAKLGMMFSCNAMFVNRSAPWIPIYGQDKAAWVAPMASLIKGGVMPTAEFEGLNLISGAGPTPMAFLAHFVTRKNDRGEMIAPSEAIDRVSALKAATIWAGYFVMREKELGSLEQGKMADFQVLNKDYFTIPEAQLGEVYPLMTVLGGKTITLREEWAKELGTQPVGAQIKFAFKTEFDDGGGE